MVQGNNGMKVSVIDGVTTEHLALDDYNIELSCFLFEQIFAKEDPSLSSVTFIHMWNTYHLSKFREERRQQTPPKTIE